MGCVWVWGEGFSCGLGLCFVFGSRMGVGNLVGGGFCGGGFGG